jgi:hypothetical protein
MWANVVISHFFGLGLPINTDIILGGVIPICSPSSHEVRRWATGKCYRRQNAEEARRDAKNVRVVAARLSV